jgi:uracil-DNA glycosylase
MQSCTVETFEEWREHARNFLGMNIKPADIQWQCKSHSTSLFSAQHIPQATQTLSVPAEFMPYAKTIAYHSDPIKWSLLYECLWRLTHREKKLLKISTDPLIRKLDLFYKAIRRDAHKAKAFVRFREYPQENQESHYIAWHDPDHNILPLVAEFFKRRFNVMKWTIMTPFSTATWDGERLQFLPGVPSYEHPQKDSMEDVWQAYYRSTFNPARIKLKMMRSEMPERYWKTMPETKLIPKMLMEAEQRVDDMMKFMTPSDAK